MKNILKIIPVICLLVITSCSKLDINTNPVQPVTAPSNLRLPAILGNMAYHAYSHSRFGVYNSLYLSSRYNTSTIESLWNYNSITRLGAWRWHYFDVGSNCQSLIRRAEEEGSNNYLGVAKIILAYSYLTATDSFGDMPFTEAFTGSFNPLYDSQEQVYASINTLLDEGLAALNTPSSSGVTMNAESDLIYAGDLNKWASFAEAVRARMLIHTANFTTGGYENTLTTVNKALADYEDALFKYPDVPTREWEKNLWGPSIARPEWNFADITNNIGDAMHTDFFMNYLTVNDQGLTYDPRLFKLTSPGVNNKYLAARATEGLNTATLPTGTTMDDFANLYNGFWTADNSPLPYILKEELYFIKAEAAFYNNQPSIAFNAYIDGIRTNMERLGVSSGEITSYLSSNKIKQNENQLLISDIMTQKYIALYMQGETWVDMRRHNYSANSYPGIYYPSRPLAEWQGKWPQRLPYDPQTEYIYNPQEIARLGAAARNWVFTPVWWAEKSQLNID